VLVGMRHDETVETAALKLRPQGVQPRRDGRGIGKVFKELIGAIHVFCFRLQSKMSWPGLTGPPSKRASARW